MFDLQTPLWELVARGAIVYVTLLVMVRLTGKRTVGQFTPFDLLVVMLLSEAVSNALSAGDESVVGGLVVAATLVGLDVLIAMASSRSAKVDTALQGNPVLVGRDGVDKRLDVLATAIRLGGTVDHLASLDLAYAPPYGSARDPIHIAGFMADNEHRGLDRFVAPSELAALPAETQLLDVRTPAERAADPCPDAVAIPLAELRGRAGELDRDRPVVTICKGGQRAYFASRILRQRGFDDVRTATGGMLAWHGMRHG